jgi:hypothetical protein
VAEDFTKTCFFPTLPQQEVVEESHRVVQPPLHCIVSKDPHCCSFNQVVAALNMSRKRSVLEKRPRLFQHSVSKISIVKVK